VFVPDGLVTMEPVPSGNCLRSLLSQY
jgi:hypothetical protein